MISGIGDIFCTHAVAGCFHQNRVSKRERLLPVSKLSRRRSLQEINLETDSPSLPTELVGKPRITFSFS